MRYILAVSGGVDSVVLLDMLASGKLPAISSAPSDEIIVAHFDHGIRNDSAEDARFVETLAKKYGFLFESKREELGARASEEVARERRYAFLRELAKRHNATIMTAHHADDVVETIAINFVRGTGWRGLAVLDSPGIVRPLLDVSKSELIRYANEQKLDWHEDSTNSDTRYLRNTVRQQLTHIDPDVRLLLGLYRNRQVFLKKEIDTETQKLIGSAPYSRYLLTNVSDRAGRELLRAIFLRESGISLTRPQLARALHAVKALKAGKRFEAAAGLTIRLTKGEFVVEHSSEMLS